VCQTLTSNLRNSSDIRPLYEPTNSPPWSEHDTGDPTAPRGQSPARAASSCTGSLVPSILAKQAETRHAGYSQPARHRLLQQGRPTRVLRSLRAASSPKPIYSIEYRSDTSRGSWLFGRVSMRLISRCWFCGALYPHQLSKRYRTDFGTAVERGPSCPTLRQADQRPDQGGAHAANDSDGAMSSSVVSEPAPHPHPVIAGTRL